MSVRFPLYAKILVWFFLNLVFLALIFYGFLRAQFSLGLDWLLAGRSGDRIRAVSQLMLNELAGAPRAEWDSILERFGEAYQVKFLLFRSDGSQAGGELTPLPSLIQRRMMERIGPPPMAGRPPGPVRERRFSPLREPPQGPLLPAERRHFGLGPMFMMHTPDPSRYWVVLRTALADRERPRPAPIALVTLSDSILGGGLFIDLSSWAAVGAAVVLVSGLFWLPLVRGITRSVSQMTEATEKIAEGRFEARVKARRRDELGRLGQAVNRMAERLEGFITGQKRFMGDVAHELCSPIARMQMALGILEQRADAKQKAYVDDVREEVQHMSNLVNELLSFSKAGLQPRSIRPVPVNVADVLDRVIERESFDKRLVQIHVEDSLRVLAEPELLSRALANLIRNAVRYAGSAGPIQVSAHRAGDLVTIRIADQGEGVPEEVLAKIFDPFFRIESSRSRETGGVGLGLAIVKTCVEACGGEVVARNRKPSGLEVEIQLPSETQSPSLADSNL